MVVAAAEAAVVDQQLSAAAGMGGVGSYVPLPPPPPPASSRPSVVEYAPSVLQEAPREQQVDDEQGSEMLDMETASVAYSACSSSVDMMVMIREAMPPGLLEPEISIRDRVCKAASAGRVDVLEVMKYSRTRV